MSWGGVISLICIFIACVALTGCIQSRPDGWCAVSVEGVCVSRWHSGDKIPSGEIDMRYNGISCLNGAAVDEETKTLSNAQWCSGSVTTSGKEW